MRVLVEWSETAGLVLALCTLGAMLVAAFDSPED